MKSIVKVGWILALWILVGGMPPNNSSWPKPEQVLVHHPLDSLRFELGRKLFYDPLLSADTSTSCGSCHLSYTAFTHVDHALSHGIKDRVGKRNALPLFNLIWYREFMWDGSITRLDRQPLAPLLHPDEMGDSLPNLLLKLNASSFYRQAFQNAFQVNQIQTKDLLQALYQFVTSLVSDNSRYDRMKRGQAVFTTQEEKGYAIFKSNCNQCHAEPLFTNGRFASNSLPIDTQLHDIGRAGVTQLSADSFHFRVPSLRNLVWSFPYMHDGRMTSLRQVIKHYSQVLPASSLSYSLKDDRNQADLIAFLRTLSDTSFVLNPRFAPPINN